jgi:micrococcal nuclease
MAKKRAGGNKHNQLMIGALLTSAIAGSAFWVVAKGRPQFPLPAYEVIEVLDGDTFVTREKQQVRLRYADAPETGNCGSLEAKAKLEALVLGKPVYLKVNYHDSSRLYAEVYTPEGDVSLALVASGWARHRGPTDSPGADAARQAQEAERGIWGECVSRVPDDPDCVIKGNISSTFNGEKIYSFPGCASYSPTVIDKDLGDQWFCTETEAKKAGFRKAESCY